MKSALGKYGPIEVFRTGTFSPMNGRPQTITEDDLKEIANGYDRENAPAPVVIGHPHLDAPAFGWVEHLYVERGVLKATLENTVSEFAGFVKEGRYKRVSISMFLPSSPANPKPGKLYLKHVGFLGATAPAVPGLQPVKFAGGDGDSFWIAQDTPTAASFGDAGGELARLRLQTRGHEIDRLIEQGRVLPMFKDEVLAFAATLDDQEAVSFSEGEPASTRKDWFLPFLARQPKVVSFGEMDLRQDPVTNSAGRQKHNIPDGYRVDRQNEDMFFAAQRLAKENGISFADSVDLVIDGRG